MKVPIAEIEAASDRYGLDDIGAVPACPVPVDPDIAARLVARAPKDLDYLGTRLRIRLDPDQLLPGVRTVLSALVSYGSSLPGVEALPAGAGFISRFAWATDYHAVIGRRMKKLASFLEQEYGGRVRWFVDTGPVFEKAYAVSAGHGFVGKNSLIITPRFGSWVFLGTILTDLEVDAPSPAPQPGSCGKCRICQDACPTAALDEAYVLDSSLCLAHLTVSDKAQPSPNLAPKLAGNLYGCDICQDVCPYNLKAEKPTRPEFEPLPGLYMPQLDDILALDDEAFRVSFGKTPMRRRKRHLLQATARLLKKTL